MANVLDKLGNTLDTGVPIKVTVDNQVYVNLAITIVIATTIVIIIAYLFRKKT
ncbi:MAG: hypothetical protein PHX80_05465 [Candidatus Nanoarchaeia archaeon]|nr:hypothetical protein [Candidatus Nanoarchaeia archaeon]